MEIVVSSTPFELKTEIVRAGAGAGKTTRLTHHVLDVVSDFFRAHGRYPHLVVTTFTRKATQELRERLMLEAVRREDTALLEYVNSKSHLSISTIHGVLNLFLSRFASHIHLDPAFRVVDGPELRRESKKILRQLLVTNPDAQALLEEYRFDDLNELCLTYFNSKNQYPEMAPFAAPDYAEEARRWAQELSTRCRQFADRVLREMDLPKWHEFAQAVQDLSDACLRQPWAEARAAGLLRVDSLRKPSKTAKNPGLSDAGNDEWDHLREDLKGLQEPRFDPEHWAEVFAWHQSFEHMADRFCDQLQAHKYRQGQLQMADLELASLDIMRRYPDLASSFSDEWDYWLIDEYQDTSPIQVQLLERLIGGRPYFVVGDPQQSIYLFRGARMEVFAQKETHVETTGGQQSYLRRNYRSRPELLLFFNDLFADVHPSFQPMEPREGIIDRSQVVATFAIAAKPEEESAPDTSELDAIVCHVLTLLQAGTAPEEICVLARANRHLLEVAQALQKYQIATQVHAASGFGSRREILDALALLKFLVNPHDNGNVMELLRSPWFRIEDAELVKLAVPSQQSLWTHLLQHAQDDSKRVIHQLQEWRSEAHVNGWSAVLTRALIQHGYIDFSHHHDATGRREANLWKFVTRLRNEERRAGFNYLDFVANSLVDLRNSEGAEDSDATPALEPNRVNLMTVHSSKGLQFQHVIVPFAGRAPQTTKTAHFVIDEDKQRWSIAVPVRNEDRLTQPWLGYRQICQMREREERESDRVFYVALTRAKQSIFMSWTGQPKMTSWASRLKFDLSSGLHTANCYSFEVQSGPWLPQSLKRELHREVVIRDPFLPGLGLSSSIANEHNPYLTLQHRSVTELLEERANRHLPSSQEFSTATASTGGARRALQRIQRSVEGTLAHRLFELMRYQPDLLTSSAAESFAPEVTAAIHYVRHIQTPPLMKLLRDGYAEWGFVLRDGQTILEGQIDLWGVGGDGVVWIIDYKTGTPARCEQAFEQLQIYAFAVSRSGMIDSTSAIQMAVVYPFHNQVMIRPADVGAALPKVLETKPRVDFSSPEI
jgi:ATP-dependent helicase/nuclease subunit A